MARPEIITGLDIGTSTVRVVVGSREYDGSVRILGVGEALSQGVSKGNIVDVEEVVSAVSEALERAERMSGQAIERAVIGVNGSHIKVVQSQGVVAVSRANNQVEPVDVERALDAAQAVATPPNYEILHVLPVAYTLDNQKNIKDPIGMSGIRLEAQAQLIMGLSSQIKNISKCVYRTGIEVEGFVFSILATASAVLDKRQKDIGVVVVNIGSSTTSLVVYEEGEVLYASSLPIGSDHITQDLAIGLRTGLDVAEAVKIDFGVVDPAKVSKREEIDLNRYASSEQPRTTVSSRHVAEIINARLDEIFEMVDKELKLINRSAGLPAGVVLTGGGAKLQGIIDVAKDRLRLPAFLGKPLLVGSAIEKINDPRYTTALGLVHYALNGGSAARGSGQPVLLSVRQSAERLTGWFKKLLP
ncbi:MAG: cell division protein FtsA [Candidatus Komeilibacteria bacterium]